MCVCVLRAGSMYASLAALQGSVLQSLLCSLKQLCVLAACPLSSLTDRSVLCLAPAGGRPQFKPQGSGLSQREITVDQSHGNNQKTGVASIIIPLQSLFSFFI